jgi:uncharacterized Zn-finger protein
MAVSMATEGWTCRTCGRKVCSQQSLQRHEALHSGKRPFCCTLCNRRFRLPGSRDHHQIIHGRPDGPICTVCGTMFSRRGYVKEHMRRIHGLLAGGRRREIRRKERLSASEHDDNNEASPAGQGRDDDSPGSEHQTEPKNQRRHRAAPAEDEIADWYECDELIEQVTGQH